jgi:hypothetical protein
LISRKFKGLLKKIIFLRLSQSETLKITTITLKTLTPTLIVKKCLVLRSLDQ